MMMHRSAPCGLTNVTAASPEPPTITDALTRHYIAHGLPSDGGESSPWFHVHIGSLTLRLPNPPARRRAVFFHDVNHILTGYDTAFSGGEVAIAAFEVASGCGRYWIVWYINLTMFAVGLVVNPRAVFRAFARGTGTSSIYRRQENRDALSAMSVAELRALLRIDDAPRVGRFSDRVRFGAWSIVAGAVMIVPVAAAALVLAGVIDLVRR